MQKLFIKRLSQNGIIPKKGSQQAAGYDLYSAEKIIVPAHGKAVVPTGIAIQSPRSGLASKFHIDVGAGVIDADYTGEIGVLLFNFSDHDFVVQSGDRIAQMIIEYVVRTEIQEVDDLSQTLRGVKGFGSTGIN
ncbi:hypothetical protein pb186bvf_014343 [Paramecium bursaria]